MSITEAVAIEIAKEFLKKKEGTRKKRRRGYTLLRAEFREEFTGDGDVPFRSPRPAQWLVRFMRDSRAVGVVIDGGEQIVCVVIDVESGKAKVKRGW
ncbi:hypothetical protein [Planctomyces sp. SH-PL14]|uniref:hypothetical protein n=1 Tax=Planctomyces sp. SH-PL14 TaxID=1632864 RepID=UPI00094663A6|nr:hypothetical protein [Planctomyces sp. SH-PL14]